MPSMNRTLLSAVVFAVAAVTIQAQAPAPVQPPQQSTNLGSDPNGNPLTYSIWNRPSWATFSASTGRLSGTPTSAKIGTFSKINIL